MLQEVETEQTSSVSQSSRWAKTSTRGPAVTGAHVHREEGADTVLCEIRGGRRSLWRVRNQGKLLGRGGKQGAFSDLHGASQFVRLLHALL